MLKTVSNFFFWKNRQQLPKSQNSSDIEIFDFSDYSFKIIQGLISRRPFPFVTQRRGGILSQNDRLIDLKQKCRNEPFF
jgi:hypothetical protein